MAAYSTDKLATERVLLIITSTYGDGEPPDNASAFHTFLHSGQAPQLPATHFAVFALGDSQYPGFCACGKQFDARLAELGAARLAPRLDADVEYEEPFASWQSAIGDAIASLSSTDAPGSRESTARALSRPGPPLSPSSGPSPQPGSSSTGAIAA
jgi:sulfite reductase (NADPH) flavoprotein alpha-component